MINQEKARYAEKNILTFLKFFPKNTEKYIKKNLEKGNIPTRLFNKDFILKYKIPINKCTMINFPLEDIYDEDFLNYLLKEQEDPKKLKDNITFFFTNNNFQIINDDLIFNKIKPKFKNEKLFENIFIYNPKLISLKNYFLSSEIIEKYYLKDFNNEKKMNFFPYILKKGLEPKIIKKYINLFTTNENINILTALFKNFKYDEEILKEIFEKYILDKNFSPEIYDFNLYSYMNKKKVPRKLYFYVFINQDITDINFLNKIAEKAANELEYLIKIKDQLFINSNYLWEKKIKEIKDLLIEDNSIKNLLFDKFQILKAYLLIKKANYINKTCPISEIKKIFLLQKNWKNFLENINLKDKTSTEKKLFLYNLLNKIQFVLNNLDFSEKEKNKIHKFVKKSIQQQIKEKNFTLIIDK